MNLALIRFPAFAFLMTLAAALLTACPSVGIPTPDTFNQKAAVALSTDTPRSFLPWTTALSDRSPPMRMSCTLE